MNKKTSIQRLWLTGEDLKPGNDIQLELSECGATVGLWLNGHDYSDNGIVLDAIVKLIGETALQKLWMAAEDDFCAMRNKRNDPCSMAKNDAELKMEREGA